MTTLTLNTKPENPRLLTIQQVYGRMPNIPDEYETVAFRYPSFGDLILVPCGDPPRVEKQMQPSERGGYPDQPRIIVRRKTPDLTGMPWIGESRYVSCDEIYGAELLRKPLPSGWSGFRWGLLHDGDHYLDKDGSVSLYDGRKLPFVALVLTKINDDQPDV